MCLTHVQPFKVLDSPVFCYKILRSDNRSINQNHQYVKNKENPYVRIYVSSLGIKKFIFQGYHTRVHKYLTVSGIKILNESLFVIPPQTIFYKGLENGENIENYVSEKIIFLGKINGFFGPVKEWYYKYKYLKSLKKQ